MADISTSNGASALLLRSTSHIPIAQLTPLLAVPSTRSVKAIVTLTWPYSSATGSVAFLLVEPDFRLRRIRGQVRVQFSGSSARAVSKSGIASGDEVILGLDGVAWVQDETPFATPGRGVEFDLKFTERLLLQFRQEDSQEAKLIDIDHPSPEPEIPSQARIPSPEAAPPSPYASPYTTANSSGISTGASFGTKNEDEWSSPAFSKRARISYGSLFDKEYDPFAEEDGSIRGKGRKRTRLSSTWTYRSRSPSPEAEQENTLNTSPEPAYQPAPMMTDEGCQTVGLEDGDAAEVLAAFHKQATNVRRTYHEGANGTMASEAQSQTQEGSGSSLHEKHRDLPTIHTQLNADIAKVQGHESHIQVTPQKMPSSPRLQPIPSDALPLVSPLVTQKPGAFGGMGSPQGIVGQVPSFNEQVPTPIEEHEPIAEEEQEDLYGASPAAIHGQGQVSEFDAFQDPSVGFDALQEASSMQDQFISEDQYGHWQAASANLSRGASPHKILEEMRQEELHGGFYVEGREEETDFENHDFQVSASDEPRLQQYPDPDEVNYGQPNEASWGPGPTPMAYPGLPEPDDGLGDGHVVEQALQPGAVAMSRSGSAQSAAIDLTESSDEEVAEGDYESDIPLGHLVDDEDDDRSDVSDEGAEDEQIEPNQNSRQKSGHGREDGYRDLGEESEEDDGEEHSLRNHPIHGRPLPDSYELEDEGTSQNSQDEELYEEEIYEEDFVRDEGQPRRYPPGFDPEQGDDFDEEGEESRDEANEDYDQSHQPSIQREPVVIDLLSSDDEDGGEAPQPKPESSSEPDTSPRRLVEAEDDERSESEEDMDAEHDMLTDLRTRHPQHLPAEHSDEDENERFVIEEDDTVADAEDEDLPDTGDEAGMEARASGDGKYNGKPTEIHEGMEIAHPDESLEGKGDALESGNDEKIMAESHHDAEVAQHDESSAVGVLNRALEEAEDVELEGDSKSLSLSRHALQEVEGNREPAKPGDKDGESEPSEVEAPVRQRATPPSPPPPTLFAQMFNLDGANDERLPSLYPILPKEEGSVLILEALITEPNAQPEVSVDDRPSRDTNGQLPTPEATQLSFAKESSDVSISSVTGQAIPVEPLQTTPDATHTHPTVEDASQLMKEDEAVPADDTAANVETETTGTEVIDERTANIIFEENNLERAQHMKVAQVVVESHNLRSRTRQQNGSLEPVVHEEVQAVEEVISSNPRRSHRRGKSKSSVIELPQTKVPTTPSKPATKARQDEPASARTDRSSSIILDERTTPKGHDASIELAMSALDSPVKQPHDLRSKQPGGDMKLRLTRALRTELSEFTSLKVLRYHVSQKLDVLGIATTVPAEPERAKGGPRHYQITFNITDQSTASGGSTPVTEVQVFRPYKDALPLVKVGDGILLRNFLVISVKKGGFALQSTDASSWAVFTGDEEEVEVRGPPVEYGAGEQKHINMLRTWYSELETSAVDKIFKANGEKSTGKGIDKVF